MIKKIIIAGWVCLFAASLHAQRKLNINLNQKDDTQVSPIVREKVEEYAAKINNIIQEEKRKMDLELQLLAEKKLLAETADREKAAIADRYSEKIDQRIEALGFDLDDVIQKQVRYSLLNTDAASNEELKAQLLKKFRPTRNLTGYASYGVMVLTNEEPDNTLDSNIGYNSNLEFGFKFNYQLSRTSPWSVISGLGFSWRTVRLDNDKYFTKTEQSGVAIADYTGNQRKNKLRTGYLMVPFGFQYNFSKLRSAGMDIRYRRYDDSFRVGANIYGGVRMSTNNIVRGSGPSFRSRENYYVNPFIYGAQVTFSYKDISLFVRRDFSNYFEKGYFPDDKALVVGIGIGL